jgi:glutamyl-tRNA synthetase
MPAEIDIRRHRAYRGPNSFLDKWFRPRPRLSEIMSVRTRFAPSPTGYLHIGGVRTALFNWLLARHYGGQFILRIDDTDQERHVEAAVGMILDGFRWMGMNWDEGPEVGGSFGPYFQSQRGEKYKAAADRLVASGHAYRDYSTDAERAAAKKAADEARTAFRFRGTPPTAAEIARYDAEGRPYALRFQVPLGRSVVIHDLIKGDVEQKTDEMGDFVIVRAGGHPLYNFASVVDDADMGITHVVRAEEHLANTFSQILVFEALGYELPAFAHVPYVAAPGSRKKLSKRDGAVGLDEYMGKGYLPAAMMNYLARVGWSLDASQEIFSRDELIEKFSLDRVNSSPASHDPDKLFWLQGEWMKTIPLAEKVESVIPFLRREGLVGDEVHLNEKRKIAAVVSALGDRLKTFSDILTLGRYFFTETLTHDPDAVKKRLRKPGVAEMLVKLDELLATVEPYEVATLEPAVHDFAETNAIKMGDVVNPLRVATTGQGVGPGLYDCLEILGRESCRARIAATLAMLDEGRPA